MSLTINERSMLAEVEKIKTLIDSAVATINKDHDDESIKTQGFIMLKTALIDGYSIRNLKKLLKHEGY